MSLPRHYKTYYRAGMVEKPNPWYPDFDRNPTVMEFDPYGVKFEGLFIPDQSGEVLVAQTIGIGTKGRFITDADAPIDSKSVIKEGHTGFTIEITADPLVAPDSSPTQSKRYMGEITGRGA